MSDVENPKRVTFQEIIQEDEGDKEEENESITESYFNRKKVALSCVIILLILSVILFIVIGTNVGGSTIEGSLHFHSTPHHRTCEDQQYGCCEIYTDCRVKGSRVDHGSNTLSMYRVLPHDNIKSNCPSLEYLIAEYNKHYGNMTTDCGQYGCCPGLNIGCDETIRGVFTEGNNLGTIDKLRNNSKMMNIMIPKKDNEGTNCKKGLNLMVELEISYEDYYPKKSDDYSVFVVLLCLLMIAVCLKGL